MRAGIPFVCVPFGTRNHFALDLGLDRDHLLVALAAYSDRQERAVDVGVVGDHVVMNNVAFGVYAEVVHSDAYRDSKIRESAKVTRELLRGDRDPDAVTIVDPAASLTVRRSRCRRQQRLWNQPGALGLRPPRSPRPRPPPGLHRPTPTPVDLASLLWAATFSDTTDHDTFVQWTTTESSSTPSNPRCTPASTARRCSSPRRFASAAVLPRRGSSNRRRPSWPRSAADRGAAPWLTHRSRSLTVMLRVRSRRQSRQPDGG